ncbi:MAG: hypothetical protein KGM15_01355 [Pseudomonadota bacterium]|nr:hypothetical protein [Pseudomonadota bacterium]
MNVSSALGALVVFASVAASPALAAMSDSKALGPAAHSLIVKADFVQGHEAVGGVSARAALARPQMAKVMAQRYFDFDVIITLGALALASGAFVAAGVAGSRRRSAQDPAAAPREGWREEVMQALEADLTQFSTALRRAA